MIRGLVVVVCGWVLCGWLVFVGDVFRMVRVCSSMVMVICVVWWCLFGLVSCWMVVCFSVIRVWKSIL